MSTQNRRAEAEVKAARLAEHRASVAKRGPERRTIRGVLGGKLAAELERRFGKVEAETPRSKQARRGGRGRKPAGRKP